MKRSFTLLLFLSISLSFIYAQSRFYEPYYPENLTWDQGKKIAYEEEDSVFVSMAFSSFGKDVCSMEITIDNQSSYPINFNTEDVYLIRYCNDSTIEDEAIYYACQPFNDADSIDKEIAVQKQKLTNNTVFSIFLGAAYIAANIASIGNYELAQNMGAIELTHDLAQLSLSMARSNNQEKIESLSYERHYLFNQSISSCTIEPKQYSGGLIRFNVPYSDFYKFYVAVNGRIYHFTFYNGE